MRGIYRIRSGVPSRACVTAVFVPADAGPTAWKERSASAGPGGMRWSQVSRAISARNPPWSGDCVVIVLEHEI